MQQLTLVYYTKNEELEDKKIFDLIENNVSCLHKLFLTINNKEQFKSFVRKIDIILSQKNYKPKLRFKLMDIKDLY